MGELSTNEWEGNDGAKRFSLEVRANNVVFLSQPQSITDGHTVQTEAKTGGTEWGGNEIPF